MLGKGHAAGYFCHLPVPYPPYGQPPPALQRHCSGLEVDWGPLVPLQASLTAQGTRSVLDGHFSVDLSWVL